MNNIYITKFNLIILIIVIYLIIGMFYYMLYQQRLYNSSIKLFFSSKFFVSLDNIFSIKLLTNTFTLLINIIIIINIK